MAHAAIDIHTHILPPGWEDWAARYGVTGWPSCRLRDACNATIYLGDIAKWAKVIAQAGIKLD
jgi:hypothetical protein